MLRGRRRVALTPGTPEAYAHAAERGRHKWRMNQPGAGPQEPEKPIDLDIDLKQLYEIAKARLNGGDAA